MPSGPSEHVEARRMRVLEFLRTHPGWHRPDEVHVAVFPEYSVVYYYCPFRGMSYAATSDSVSCSFNGYYVESHTHAEVVRRVSEVSSASTRNYLNDLVRRGLIGRDTVDRLICYAAEDAVDAQEEIDLLEKLFKL